MMDIKQDQLQWFTSFLIKKSVSGSGVAMRTNISAIKSMLNQQLANELHKPIIRKF